MRSQERDGVNNVGVTLFFEKMEGDYNRYGTEISSGVKRERSKSIAANAYQIAKAQTAWMAMGPADLVRLDLDLALSEFHYEICGEHQDCL